MTNFLTASSSALAAAEMADALVASVEADRIATSPVVGGLLLATAATGEAAVEVGGRLAEQWPNASIVGTSFEGVLAEGFTLRDEPAMVLLAWSSPEAFSDAARPRPFVIESTELSAEQIAETVCDAAGRSEFAPGDVILLFPDAHRTMGLEALLSDLGPLLAPASLAGAGATGIDGHDAHALVGGEGLPGALIGVFVPAPVPTQSEGKADWLGARVRCAHASRSASPWLEITRSRSRWVDELDGEPALHWVRRQLGLERDTSIAPYLDRLLARVRGPSPHGGPSPNDGDERSDGYDERYVVGLDDGRGSFSWPGPFSRGDELALALPDAERARDSLRCAVAELEPASHLLQFACRARDVALHGDAHLESAWAAHCAGDRSVVGTVAPFQLATDAGGEGRVLVHASVLAGLGRA